MAIVLFRQCGFEIPIEANVAGTIANNIGAPLLYLLWNNTLPARTTTSASPTYWSVADFPFCSFALLGLISSSSQTMGLRAVILLVAAVALTRCYRSMDWSAPMYAERPLDHRRTYLNVMVLSWKSALCIGSLAFLYTVLRSAFTSSNSTLNGILTYAPLLGMLGSVLGHHGAMAAPLLLFQCHTGVPLALSVPALPICRHSAIRHSAPSDHLRHRVWNLFSSGIP